MNYETSETEQVQPIDWLRMIWKRKWLVLFVAGAVFGIFVWRTYTTEPVYEAVTTVQFSVPAAESAVVDRLEALVAGASRGIESEIEVLRSRVIAERTAVRLQRHYTLQPLPPDVVLEVTDLTVTDNTLSGTYTLTFVDDQGRYRVSDPEGKMIGTGKAGEAFKAGGVSFTISNVSARSGSTAQITIHKLANVANSLGGNLLVLSIRGTDIVSLRVRENDLKQVARTANAFAETYVEFTREQKIRRLLSVQRFLGKQIESFRQDLMQAGQALAKSGLEKRDPEIILEHLRKDILPGTTIVGEKGNVLQELTRRLVGACRRIK